ncbi:signal recognition particle protein [bacterium]|nr:signal recognition particle protein [bacterium]
MLDSLTEKFTNVFNKLRGQGRLTESNIEVALRDVRLALLEADVHVGVVKAFLEKVKAKALGQEVLGSLTPAQEFLRIVHEELAGLLKEKAKPFILEGKSPHIILMVGLQGSGKTTTTGKLAGLLKKKGMRPYLVPADIQRPAAIEQLQKLGGQLGVPVYPTTAQDDPVKVAKRGVEEAERSLCDVVLVDTAGRLHVDDTLMDELKRLHKKLPHPPKVLFVVDAMIGQEAVRVTKAFDDLLKIDGVVLTKLDGDAKGGAVLSIQHVTQCPVYFMGMGEKLDEIEAFDPDRLVNRLLDRGDLLSLVEKAQEIVNVEEAQELAGKIKKNKFDLDDFRTQLKQMKKLGSVKNLMGYLPGMKAMAGKMDMDRAEAELKVKEAILNSMTMAERKRPEILNGNRRLRIAKGSGTQVSDVNRLVKEFGEMQKMMKMFTKGGMGALKGLLGK